MLIWRISGPRRRSPERRQGCPQAGGGGGSMGATLLDLAERMESLADALPRGAAAAVNDVALGVVEYLTDETPVDTSRALSNWQVSLGRPFMYDIGPYAEGIWGSTKAVSREQAIATARYLLSMRKPGQTIYISNNVPYIRRLNTGWSKQHAGGFVEAAVAIARRKAKNVRLLTQNQSGAFKPRKFRGGNPT